jgi:hypothetical protein
MAEGCGVPIAPVASKKRMPQIQEPLAGARFDMNTEAALVRARATGWRGE